MITSAAHFGSSLPPFATRNEPPIPNRRTGEDDYGPDGRGFFVAFELGGQTHTLRWVPPGKAPAWRPALSVGKPYNRTEVIVNHGIWLSESPVTVGLYHTVMGTRPGADCARPMTGVSFHDVSAFMARLSGLVPWLDPRVPNDEEWEYAARAGDPSWTEDGDSEEHLSRIGFHGRPAICTDVQRLEGAMNPWGLRSMQGALWQWCHDCRMMTFADPNQPKAAQKAELLHAIRGATTTLKTPRGARASRLWGDRERSHPQLGFRIAADSVYRSTIPAVTAGRVPCDGRSC